MRSKIIVIASLAIVGVMVLTIASAVTVFALIGGETVQTEEVEAAPVIVEPVAQPEVEVVKPVIEYEKVEYADGKAGCPYNHQAKNQLVKNTEADIGNDLLTQVAR